MNDAIINKVRDIIITELGVSESEFNESLGFNEIPEWDSVGHMILMAALEAKFQLQIEDHVIPSLTTIQAIVKYLQEAIRHRGANANE